MNDRELQIQIACVTWARYSNQKYKNIRLIHSHLNEGKLSRIRGALMNNAGRLTGIADLEIPPPLAPTLFVEMKAEGKYQTPKQKEFQQLAEETGNVYAVCRSVDDFKETVDTYYRTHYPEAILL